MNSENLLIRTLKSFINVLLLLFFALILICAYPVFVEPNILVVKHKKLYLPNWNSSHNGIKIAVLSDFHMNEKGINLKKLEKIVDKTNKQNPDLIFLLGDLDSYLIADSKFNKKQISKILSRFNSKYKTFAVLGNHDYGPRVVKPILLNAGIKVLENQKEIVNVNSNPIVIYGLKDLWHYSPDPQKIVKKMEGYDSLILLSHNPDLFPAVPSHVSLTLSGHTHGGQVCLPFLGGIFTPSMWEQRYNKGYIVENGKHLYVTSGLGFSIPFRFGNPPEIVVLELYSQKTYPSKIIKNTKPLTGLKQSLNKYGMAFATRVLGYLKEL